ncbi:hypothetical protein [Mangrovihabitans endophyticus]|uniref:Uncharacterized protein n=1 Tax=Mangrovihabitans endophyticus TaxID=1751298 RepID=A0A8J3BXX8_9ACTN|nr:hypothetical protein [Mangrovihabitans endophyticus]GGK80754.1 hypothetical protein GCM10012284_13390 [Mangrovihabitans endophyticus]
MTASLCTHLDQAHEVEPSGPGEDWWWFYFDEVTFRVGGTPSHSYRRGR